jgi:large subunit ribosomal protein L22
MSTTTRQFDAKLRYARITARKARLVADLIRGQPVNRALELLSFAPQRAAAFYSQLVKSAVANAGQDEKVNLNRLVVSECRADDGPLLNNRMRYRPGPQGRAMPIRKRTAHLCVGVSEAGDGRRAAEPEQPAQAVEAAPQEPRAKQKSAGKKPSRKETAAE